LEEQRAEGIGEREYDVEVPGRENPGKGSFYPLGPFTPLAFGAVPIATRVVGEVLGVAAGRTCIQMPPKPSSAAHAEPKQDLALP
jgi:hypothetical protein